MPTKIKNKKPDPNQNKDIAEKEYGYAISLMQYATELLSQQFGVFMLVETIITGYLGNVLIQNNKLVLGENLLAFWGSILGLFICIPWYLTFKHNYKAYRLRIKQAKRHEKLLGINLFTEYEQEYNKSKIPLLFRPQGALTVLIFLFGLLFIVLILFTRPCQ